MSQALSLPARIASSSTPYVLRRLRLAVVGMLLLFAFCAGFSVHQATSSNAAVTSNVEQYDRVYSIGAHVTSANAAAIHALSTGQPLPDSFRTNMVAAHQQLTAAAVAQPEDRATLDTLSARLQEYNDLVTGALVTHTKTPTSAAGDAEAATVFVHEQIIPLVDDVARNDAERTSISVLPLGLLLGVVGCLSLILVILTSVFLAIRSHRVLNVGLVAATLLVLSALVLSTVSIRSTSAHSATARKDTLPAIHAMATAGIDSNAAHSYTSLGVLSHSPRYVSMANEHLDHAAAAITQTNDSTSETAFTSVKQAHDAVAAKLSAGSFAEAAKASDAVPVEALGQALRARSSSTTRGAVDDFSMPVLRTAGPSLGSLIAIAALLGATVGIGRRLDDYR